MMKKLSILILTIFLLSLIPVLGQDTDVVRADLINSVESDGSEDRDDSRLSLEQISRDKDRIVQAREKFQEGIAKLTERNQERLKKLNEEQQRRLANINPENLRKIAQVGEQYLDKIANLNEEQLKKLVHLDRETFKRIAGKDREQIARDLEKLTIKIVKKGDLFKKRIVLEDKLAEAKANFDRAVLAYNSIKEEFKVEKAAFEEAVAEKDEAKAIEHGKKFLKHAADMAIKTLERVKHKAEGNDDLTEEELAEIVKDINAKIEALEQAKEELEAADTKETVKAAGEVILNAWNRAKYKIELHTEKIVRSKVGEIIERSKHLEARLEALLTKLEAEGIEIGSLDTMVDLFSMRISEAKEKFKIGEELFKEAKKSIGKSQGVLVKQAKTFTKEAHKALKAADEILKDIKEAVKEAGAEFDVELEDEIEIVEEIEEEVELEDKVESEDEDAAEKAEDKLVDAEEKITKATHKIAEREADGKDVTNAYALLEEAKALFNQAIEAYHLGDFALAEELAEEAKDKAGDAKSGDAVSDVDDEDESEDESEDEADEVEDDETDSEDDDADDTSDDTTDDESDNSGSGNESDNV